MSDAFYDRGDVFDRYHQHRSWPLNPNNTLEEPAFLDELGSVKGARVLDLGCGEAQTGLTLLAAGCESYLGIDNSQRMIAAAQTVLADTQGHAQLGDLEHFESPAQSFDLVVSRMVLHYLEDIASLLTQCHDSLVSGGRIVLTVNHPVITSHDQRTSTEERRQDWVVDDYFLERSRPQVWLGETSVWHHRTIETYVRELRTAGFALTNLRECPPVRELFNDASEFERRQRIPLMLLLSGVRT